MTLPYARRIEDKDDPGHIREVLEHNHDLGISMSWHDDVAWFDCVHEMCVLGRELIFYADLKISS